MVIVSAFSSQLLRQLLQPLLGRPQPGVAPKARQVQDASSASLSEKSKLASLKSQGAAMLTESSPTSYLLDSMKAAVKANAEKLAELRKTGHDPAKRIAEIQDQIKQLLKRMQRAALLGDKHAAAAIAREAAGLAKELAAAIKEAAADGQSSGSSAAMASAPLTNPTTMVPQSEAETSSAAASENSSTSDEPAGTAPQPLPIAVAAVPVPQAQNPVDEELIKEASKAVLMLRSIIALAKMTIERKDSSRKMDPQTVKDLGKELAIATRDLDAAVASIQADTEPPTGAPQIGLTLHFSADG
jgi:hypothetical protein